MKIKRLFDLTLTVPALILPAPLFGLTALLVRFKLGGPVIFRQERTGRSDNWLAQIGGGRYNNRV